MDFGASWGAPGHLLGRLGGVLGASWGVSGASWGRLAALGRLRSVLRRSCGRLGGILGASWGHLGASWGPLGASWGHLGAILGRLGTLLGVSWGVLAAKTQQERGDCEFLCPLGTVLASFLGGFWMLFGMEFQYFSYLILKYLNMS